jgi:hypothetical protein
VHPAVTIPPDCPSGLATGVPRITSSGVREGGSKLRAGRGMRGARFTRSSLGQALTDRLALKPYWGKPAVRNFRGGGGNVGIIRSPVRATPCRPYSRKPSQCKRSRGSPFRAPGLAKREHVQNMGAAPPARQLSKSLPATSGARFPSRWFAGQAPAPVPTPHWAGRPIHSIARKRVHFSLSWTAALRVA